MGIRSVHVEIIVYIIYLYVCPYPYKRTLIYCATNWYWNVVGKNDQLTACDKFKMLNLTISHFYSDPKLLLGFYHRMKSWRFWENYAFFTSFSWKNYCFPAIFTPFPPPSKKGWRKMPGSQNMQFETLNSTIPFSSKLEITFRSLHGA